MTVITVILIGAGALLIASAMDCTSIKDTFQKIVSNQKVDWSGTQNCGSVAANQSAGNAAIQQAPNAQNGKCPQGQLLFQGKCLDTTGLGI